MSMTTEITYGFGIPVPEIPNENQMKALNAYLYHNKTILEQDKDIHPTYADILPYVQNPENIEISILEKLAEYLLNLEAEDSVLVSPYNILTMLLSHIYDIYFIIDEDTETEKQYLILPASMPWHYNQTEKDLSEDIVISIFDNLNTLLNLNGPAPDMIRIEHFS